MGMMKVNFLDKSIKNMLDNDNSINPLDSYGESYT